jgi:hypothetical protein
MKSFVKSVSLSVLLLTIEAAAFMSPVSQMRPRPALLSVSRLSRFAPVYASSTDEDIKSVSHTSEPGDNEVERLRSMAAKLRAEAALLEAQRAQELADATERAFKKFDTNQDGVISRDELKSGLEKVLKLEMKEAQVEKLMKEFDGSGDGTLQLDEFATIDTIRNRLEAIVREEKEMARKTSKAAKMESEAAALLQAQLDLLNDKPPTTSDKILSVIPYLLPLLDGLQFGRFLLSGEDNPVVNALGLLFIIYRSIPFSGFIAFLALSFLSGNLSINRQIRFNMQQAIFLDIALFFPSLIASLYTIVLSGLGVKVPEVATQIGNDAVFITLVAAVGYSVVSSLLGKTPDKLPFISDRVIERMPTVDMFDDQGRFIGFKKNEDEKKDE